VIEDDYTVPKSVYKNHSLGLSALSHL